MSGPKHEKKNDFKCKFLNLISEFPVSLGKGRLTVEQISCAILECRDNAVL